MFGVIGRIYGKKEAPDQFKNNIQSPFPRDQIQSHHHKGLNGHQGDSYHQVGHQRKAAFSSLHTALCHMRNSLPIHLFKKGAYQHTITLRIKST